MTKKKERFIQSVYDTVSSKFGNTDRWGNYVIKGKSRTFRVKPQSISLRFEIKLGSQWKSLYPDKVIYISRINIEKLEKYLDTLILASNDSTMKKEEFMKIEITNPKEES